jgi:hypothetical protein
VVGDVLDLGTLLATKPTCSTITVDAETSNVDTDNTLKITANAIGDFKVKITANGKSVEVTGNIISKALDAFRKQLEKQPLSNNNYEAELTWHSNGHYYTQEHVIRTADYSISPIYNSTTKLEDSYEGGIAIGEKSYEFSGKCTQDTTTYAISVTEAAFGGYRVDSVTDNKIFPYEGGDWWADQVDTDGKPTGKFVMDATVVGEENAKYIGYYENFVFGVNYAECDALVASAKYATDGSFSSVMIEENYKKQSNDMVSFFTKIGSADDTFLKTWMTGAGATAPAAIDHTELGTQFDAFNTAKSYQLILTSSYVDANYAAVTDADTLKALNGTDPASFETLAINVDANGIVVGKYDTSTKAITSVVSEYITKDNKIYSVAADSANAGKYIATDITADGASIWENTTASALTTKAITSTALADLNTISREAAETTVSLSFDTVDCVEVVTSMFNQVLPFAEADLADYAPYCSYGAFVDTTVGTIAETIIRRKLYAQNYYYLVVSATYQGAGTINDSNIGYVAESNITFPA